MMDIAFVVHVFDVHLHDGAADPASLRVPAHVIADIECLFHKTSRSKDHILHRSKHQAGPFPRSVSCTCLSSALLTNSTESIAVSSWVRNCSIASFIGGGRAAHPSITWLLRS